VLSGGVSRCAGQPDHGPASYLALIGARASMTGFITPGYADRHAQARAEPSMPRSRRPASPPGRHRPDASFGRKGTSENGPRKLADGGRRR
jgi:hypothetical protein